VCDRFPDATPQHYQAQGEVRHGSSGRKANGLPEPFQKNCGEYREDRERDQDLVVTEHRLEERILDCVLGGVGRRQRHRDHKIGGREAKQDQDEHFPLPSSEQALKHGDGTLSGVAAPSYLRVHWQCAKQRNKDEDDRSNRRYRARRDQRNTRLVAECREVVNAG
jgi:hypothetical protein